MGLKILLKLLPLVLIGALSAPSVFAVEIGMCKNFDPQKLCHTEDNTGKTTPAPNYRYFKHFRGVGTDSQGFCQRVAATQILEEECNIPKFGERLYKVQQLTMDSKVPAGCKCKLRVAGKSNKPPKTNTPVTPTTAAVVAENKETPGTSSTATPTPAPNSPDANTQAYINNANKNQVVDGDVVKDPVTGQYKQVSFRDKNGDGKQDAGEVVLSTNYGTLNSDGKTLDAKYNVAEADVKDPTATKYTFKDSSGKTFTVYDGKTAQELAKANGSEKITITKDGQTYVVNTADGKVAEKEKKKENEKDATDPCSVSLRLARENAEKEGRTITEQELKKFRCAGTQTWVKGAEIANQVLTTAGRTVVNTMGNQSAANARRGTFADAQDGAAKMAKTTQTYETVLGVANLAATAKLAAAARNHKQAVGKLTTWKGADAAAAKSGNMLTDTDGAIQKRQDGAMSEAEYKDALKEQNGARNLAATAAMKTAIQGMQSLTAAKVAAKIAKDAKANAKLARQNEALLAQQNFNYDPNQLAGPGNTNAYDPNAAAATGGDGTQNNSDASTTELDPNQPAGPLLGGGNDLGGGDDSLNAPVAGKFKGGGAPAGGGGGSPGGGAAGGGGGGANPAAQEEAKAAYASEFGTKERYESGGGAPGGPKGAGKGEKDDPGIDLNGLLAQFLPKGEEDLGPKNGILDSVGFGGNRNVATEEPSSLLDKNADLFQRIHDTMSEKNRRGQLGI